MRDIVMGPSLIREPIKQVNAAGPDSGLSAMVSLFGGGVFTLPPAERMVKAIGRIALAALGGMALYAFGGSATVAAALGAVVSLPATAVAAGSWMVCHGVAAAVGSVASGPLAALGIGLAYAAGGWMTLEIHDLIPFGLGDLCLEKGAEAAGPKIVKACIPSSAHR